MHEQINKSNFETEEAFALLNGKSKKNLGFIIKKNNNISVPKRSWNSGGQRIFE